MDGISMDYLQKEPHNKEEWECFFERLVVDFMSQKHGGTVSQVDIMAFAVAYLHMHIVSATFAEQSVGEAFLADGKAPLTIQQKDKVLNRVYPPGTIALERSLIKRAKEDEPAYYHMRFVVAHGCAKWICRRFHKRGEVQERQDAARLLMPRFLVQQGLEKYCGGKKIPIYGNILDATNSYLVASMANSMGVNYEPMRYRLGDLDLYEHHPVSEFIDDLLERMRRRVQPEISDVDTDTTTGTDTDANLLDF